MTFKTTIASQTFAFPDLKTLMAKATPLRSGDCLAGVNAATMIERSAAQIVLSELPLKHFLNELVIPYEQDDISRFIIDSHDQQAFTPISHLTVGDFRNWLLSDQANSDSLKNICWGLTPEMVAAVSKIMRVQDLILVAQKCEVTSGFRNSLGLKGNMATRLQPNHPTDNLTGIAASIVDGLLNGNGDAVIGINPATDNYQSVTSLLHMLNDVIEHYQIPTQACVLTHVTTQLEAINNGVPIDIVFQSIGGTQLTNESFGVSLAILDEVMQAAREQGRGTVGNNVMYFETGQGSALSANAHHGVDQQTCETRAYALARRYDPLLINSVVGFIGPEYLYDGKQIIRAGLEDHFCGKLMGLPMGVDVCYTNHAEADQDDMDMLLTQLAVAGVNFIMGIPGSDDIMLNYQTTSFHDALYVREVLQKGCAPEFEQWLISNGIFDGNRRISQTLSLGPFTSSLKGLGNIR